MSAKPLIVIFRLLYDSWFEHTNADLLSELAQKDVICKVVRSPSQARRYLTSIARPHAVILADDLVTKPKCHELHARLVEYAAAGGAVVYAGPISTSSLFPDPETMFSDVWGLPWRMIESQTSGNNTLNPMFKGIDTEGLVTQCSFYGVRIKNVALEDAVYVTDGAASKLKSTPTPPTPTKTYETPAAFARVGRGRVGYIADTNCHPREREITNLILAMCFWPGARGPVAPGDGVPESCHTSPAIEEDNVDQAKRNILVLSLEKEDHTDKLYAPFYHALRKNATVTEAKHLRAAQAALSAAAASSTSPRPDAIILSDAAFAKPKHSKILTTLVDYTRSGGTVALALQFSSNIKPAQTRPFFARWGVPWDRGSYHRVPAALNPAGVPAPLDKDALAPSLSVKAVHVKKAPHQHAVYLPEPSVGESAEESPAVFARVGRGFLGYVGDVNGELGSARLILEMCGVKIQPGDLGPGEEDLSPPLRAREARSRDAEVAVRAAARNKACEERRRRADRLKDEGNDLFRQEEWYEAAEKYREAALLAGPHPVYLSNLAACLLKLEMWELADSAASRALMYDPRHVKALYRRAVARRELERSRAALADLEWLLTIDKHNVPALKERETVRERLGLIGSLDWLGDASAGPQRDQDVAMDIEGEVDFEDFAHPGTGIACRDYNTSDTGCPDGKACRFRHAPDSKSVRDQLCRNVCVYWLLGHCRFSASGECLYAHDATYLPERGWWTDTARLERMRAEFDAAVKEEPLDLGAGLVEEHILAEAFAPLPWQKDPWVVEAYAYEDDKDDYSDDYGLGFESDQESEAGDYGYGLGSEEDSEDGCDYGYGLEEDEERGELNEFGVTDADVEEMWEYGIKPWEDGAYVTAEMLRIRRVLNSM